MYGLHIPHHLAATCHEELQEDSDRQLQAQKHLRNQQRLEGIRNKYD